MKDTKKYLYELVIRALKMEASIKEMPKQTYYAQNSIYFKRLEYRNENLNLVVKTLREELDIHLPELRIHQADARYIYTEVKKLFAETEVKRKIAV